MTWSFSIGRLFGSELRVHATFFLLLAWIATAAWVNSGPQQAIANTLFVLSLFACVVAHEFGHALVARKFGIKTPDITLLPIGGMARLERMPEDPRQEILVALAGPVVNILIWLVLTFTLGADARAETLVSLQDTVPRFIDRLASVNLFLAVFNMIPAFPMDGGRVLRAVLTIFVGRVRATELAAGAGQVIAFALGFLGLAGGNPILLLIGVFVLLAATAENADVHLRDQAHNALARDAMITEFETLSPDSTLYAAGQILIRTTQAEVPVITGDGALQGILTRHAIMAALDQNAGGQSISSFIARDLPTVRLDDSLELVLDALNTPGAPAVGVTDRRNLLLGYITPENIGEWMVVNRARAV